MASNHRTAGTNSAFLDGDVGDDAGAAGLLGGLDDHGFSLRGSTADEERGLSA